ncbi:hypothetical protein HZC09_06875 [Candidatus Micrarchaeota archaeon]|nr:hypothetical protein [Candidatus Micrarchaeota archaeon]
MTSEHFEVLRPTLKGRDIEIISVRNPKGDTFHSDLREYLENLEKRSVGTEGFEDNLDTDLLPDGFHSRAIPLDHKIAPHLYEFIERGASKEVQARQIGVVNKLRALLIVHALIAHRKPITAVLRENVAKHVLDFLGKPQTALRIIETKAPALTKLANRKGLIYVPNLIEAVQKSFESIAVTDQVKPPIPVAEPKTRAVEVKSRVLKLLRSIGRREKEEPEE